MQSMGCDIAFKSKTKSKMSDRSSSLCIQAKQNKLNFLDSRMQESHKQMVIDYDNLTGNKAKSVLIVDDHLVNVVSMQALFIKFNIHCDTASDGLDAIKVVKERHKSTGDSYKLILMDFEMPRCHGTTASVAIREYLRAFP